MIRCLREIFSLRYVLPFLAFSLAATAAFGQATVSSIKHETLTQQEVDVTFSGIVALTATPTAGWVVTINAVPVTVTNVSVLFGTTARVKFDATPAHFAYPFIIPGDAVTISYTAGGLTGANPFGPMPSSNNWIFTCGDVIFFQQGDYGTVDQCSPVVMDFHSFQFRLSLRMRNSTNSVLVPTIGGTGIDNFKYLTIWGDGVTEYLTPYFSDLSGIANNSFYDASGFGGNPDVIMTIRPVHNYPAANPGDCSFNFSTTPYWNGIAICSSLAQTNLFATYDTDNKNSGMLNLPPSVAGSEKVCLGSNVNMKFSDATVLNCRVAIEPTIPNDQTRWIRVIYGSTNYSSPGNIPGVSVTSPFDATVKLITNNNATGTFANAGFYFTGAGGVGVPDPNGVVQLLTPVTASTLTMYMGKITTSLTNNQAIGQRFYVMLQYWDICNKYDASNPSSPAPEFIENYVIIVPKPVPLTTAGASICFNGTAPNFTVGGASASVTAINWYTKDPKAGGVLIPNGTVSTSLTPAAYNSGGGVGAPIKTNNTNGGYYSVWVTQQDGTGSCESDAIEVALIQQPDLSTNEPATPTGSTAVCNGPPGTVVVYTEATAPPVKTIPASTYSNGAVINLATQNLWSQSFGAGVSVSPTSGTTTNVTYNIASQPNPSVTNNINVKLQYTAGIVPIVSPYSVPSVVPTYNIAVQSCPNSDVPLSVSVFGQTKGGVVSSDNTICDGSTTGTLTLTGFLGSVVKWQRTFNAGAPVDIPNTTTTLSEVPPSGPGTYTYYAVVQNASGGPCGTVNSGIATISVNAVPTQPVITQDPSSTGLTICQDGTSKTVLNSSNGGTGVSYLWFKGGVSTGVTTSSITLTTAAQAGTYTVQVFGSAPTNCPSPVSAGTAVIINSPPTATVTGGGSVCSGNPAPDIIWTFGHSGNYTLSYTDGTTTFGPIVLTGVTSYTLTGPTVAGTYQLTSLIDNVVSCPATGAGLGGTATVSVSATPPPTLDAFTVSAAVCDAGAGTVPPTASLDLAPNSVQHYDFTYVINGHTHTFTNVASDGAGVIILSPPYSDWGSTPGSYTIKVTALKNTTTGCAGSVPINSPALVVNPLPANPTGPVNSTYCSSGSPIAISVANPGAGLTIDWYAAATGGAVLASGTATLSYVPPAAGTYFAQTRNTSTGCVSSARTSVVSTKDTNPSAPNAGPDQLALCGSTATLAATPANNGGSGMWTVTSGVATITTPTSPTSGVTGLASAATAKLTWTVTSALGACTPQTATVTLQTNALPTANNITPQLCDDVAGAPLQTANVDLSVYNTLVSDATATVKWYTSPTRTAAFLVPPAPPGVTITNGQIFYYTTTSTVGCTAQGQATFTVNGLPSAVDKSAQFCDNMGGAGAGGINLTSFEMGAGGITAGGTTATRLVQWYEDNGSGGLGTLITTSTNYTITATKIVHGKVIDKTSPASPQCSDVADLTLIYKKKPADNPISGPGVVCTSPSGQIYQVDPTVNAYSNSGIPSTVHTYTWTVSGVPNTIIAGGGTNSANSFIFLKFPSGSGTAHFTVVETVDGCAGNVQTFDATVAGAPPALAFDTPTTQVCKGSTLTYSLTPASQDPFSIYNWSVVGGAIVGPASGPGLFTITVTWGSLTSPQPSVSVTQTSAQGCAGAPASVNVFLNDVPAMTSPGTNDVCSNSTPSLVFASSLPSTYTWKVTNITGAITGTSVGNTGAGNLGAKFTGAAALKNTSGAVGSVSFDVTPTATAAPNCQGTTQSVVLNVNPEPSLVSPQTKTICSGSPVNYEILLNPLNLPSGTTFSWPKPVMSDGSTQGTAGSAVAAGAPGTIHITDILTNTSSTSITATYSITPSSGLGCVGATKTVVITINPQPALQTTLGGTVCSQKNIGLNFSVVTGSVAAANYNITSKTVPPGVTAASGNGAVPATGVSTNYLANDQYTNISSSVQIVSYVVVPVSSAGCAGTPVTISYNINPEPVLAPGLDVSVCSDLPNGINLNTKGGSVAATGYNILSITVPTGLTGNAGNSAPATGASAGSIANDSYTNHTAGSLNVIYSVAPVSSSGCIGSPAVNVTVTVLPEPVLASLSSTVCSHIATGLTLSTNGTSVAAATYNINLRTIDPGLVANAGNATVPSAGGVTASYLANDIFTNTGSTPLNVKYTVVPVSGGGCLGDAVIVQLIINPEPVMSPSLNASVCSGLPIGLKLNTNGTSVAASSFNITARSITPGLTAGSGNAAAPATAVASSYFSNDVFTNTTSGALTVAYTVVPVASNGCSGASIVVTMTINPEPVLSTALDATVCSELPIGLTLDTNGSSVAAATYNINTITAAAGLNPSGSNAIVASGVSASYLKNDVYFNTSGSVAKKVVYNVTPVSGSGCKGAAVNVTITINPEPVLSTALNSIVCSGLATGLILNTNGTSIGAANYNVTAITVPPGLTSGGTNAVVASNVAANYLANDKFTNVTNAAISVTYTIVANSASGCPGPSGTVSVQINPEPVMSASLNTAACSDLAIALVFATNGTSVAATKYNVTARTIGSGSLTPAATNATVPATGVSSSYLAADAFTNTTASDINVTYTVAPVSALGCIGQPVVITVIIHPKPVVSTTLGATVCSGAATGVTLATNGTSIAAATYNLISVAVGSGLVSGGSNVVAPASGSNTLIKNDQFTNTTNAPINVTYNVAGVSAAGCVGASQAFTVTINPEPVIPTLDATVCSDVAIGLTLSTNGTSVAAASYNIISRTSTGLTAAAGNAPIANGVSPGYLANDKYTNLSSGPLTAVYTVRPVAASGCLGVVKTITITINPEPILSATLSTTICSGLATGITLATKTGSVAAQNYNITTIVIDAGLTAGATNGAIPAVGVNAGFITNDQFTNTTAGPLKATYTVVPVSAAGCIGDPVSVVVTVNPEPVIPNTLNKTVCSDVATGLTYITNGTSVAAANYNVLSVTIATGLTSVSKPAANGVVAAYSAGDIFTNTTTAALNVTYVVVPVSSLGCKGVAQTIVVTINPKPVVSTGLDATVCSDVVTGLNLTSTSGSAASSGWTIQSRVIDPALTPAGTNAAVPSAAGVPANYLAADKFTNIGTVSKTVTYTVLPLSSTGCPGGSKVITITVNPKPVIVTGLDVTICSDDVTGILLKTTASSVAAANYDIISRVPAAGLTPKASNVTVPATAVAPGYFTNDSFTNLTSGNLTVVYTVVPTSGANCKGDPIAITVTVRPEPVLSTTLNATVCSGLPTGLTLSVAASSVAAASYNITSIVSTGLTAQAGNAVVGNGKLSNYLAADKFVNTTNAALPVKYTIVPVSGAPCSGDPVVVTITINPEPVIPTTLGKTICSTSPTGLVLSTTASSVAAASYNVTAIAFPGTITPAPGNATTANNVAAGYLAADSWTNTTGANVSVTYTVVPVSSANCSGAAQTIIIVVTPQPVLSPSLSKGACSNTAGGISLAVASGSVAAANYNITSVTVPPGVTAVTVPVIPATGVASNYLATATYSNLTNAPLDVLFTVVPVSASGCKGAVVTVKQTINPEPVLGALDAAVCSELPINLTLNTNGTSVSATTYNYTAVSFTGMTAVAGNAVIPATGKSATYALNDKYINTTSAGLPAKYTIVPVSGALCAGASAIVTITINPEPVLSPTLSTAVCSENPSGITFATVSTSVAAANYNIASITGTSGLVAAPGNAVVANGVSSTAIKNDSYTNTTASPIIVTYSIVPVSAGGCVGLPVNVNLTVNPEPVMDPTLAQKTICSRDQTGITLNTNGVSVAAATYNITLVSQDPGLSGTPTTGTGLAATAIKADNFVNVSSNPLQIKYQIVPSSAGGCLGQPFLITITINAEPVINSSLDNAVCSKSPSNIVLGGDGVSVLANSYKLVSVTFPATITANPSNVSVGSTGGINLIKNDIYSNLTSAPVQVLYMISGTSQSGCPGQPKQITLTINPEPTLQPPTSVVCSDIPSGIILSPKAGTPAISSYILKNILLPPGITPSGSPNAGLGTYTTNNFLAADQFTNTTAGPLQVTYTLNAVSGACPGVDQTVVLTVNPAPAVATTLGKSVCTNDATGIVLSTDPVSAPASTYTIVSVTISAGLTQTAGNVGSNRTGKTANEIQNDKFNNPTSGPLPVTYHVQAVTATSCAGPVRDIVLTVEPTIISSPVNNKPDICSNDATNILLTTGVKPSAGRVTFNYTATSSIGGAMTGFIPAISNLPDSSVIADNLVNNSDHSATVTYTIKGVANGAKQGAGCLGVPIDVVVTVEPKPKLVASPLISTICEGAPSAVSLTSPTVVTSGTIQFKVDSMTVTGGMTLTSPATPKTIYMSGETLADVWSNPDTLQHSVIYYFHPLVSGGLGCSGDVVTVTLNVNPLPNVKASAQPPICSNDFVNITLTSDVAGTINKWTTTVTGTVTGAGAGSGDLIFQTLKNTGTSPATVHYLITPKASNCAGSPITVDVIVNPIPTITGVPSSASVCYAGTLTQPLASPVSGVTFKWTVDPFPNSENVSQRDSGNMISQVLTNNTGSQDFLTYTIIATGPAPTLCQSTPKIFSVIAAPQIKASFLNPDTTYLCRENNKDFLQVQLDGQAPFTFTYSVNDTLQPALTKVGGFKSIAIHPTVETVYKIVSVTDAFGCSLAGPFPSVRYEVGSTDASFAIVGPAASCSPYTATLSYNLKKGTEYTWRWGDGSPDSVYTYAGTNMTGAIIHHTYTNTSPTGTLKPKIVLQTDLPVNFPGCVKSTTLGVTIYPTIITNVYPDKSEICSGDEVIFTNQSFGVSSTGNRWFYRPQGTTQQLDVRTTQSVTYVLTNTTATNPLIIEVVYQATNGNCPAPDVVIPITVYRSAAAAFDFGGTLPAVHHYLVGGVANITFTNNTFAPSAPDPAFEYDWSFGIDAHPADTTGNDHTYQVAYTSQGIKNVTLTVTNIASPACTNTLEQNLTIELLPLIAGFTAVPAQSCFPSDIVVTSNTSTGDAMQWKLYDQNGSLNTVSTANTPTFHITDPGTYTLDLRTSDTETGLFKDATPQTFVVFDKPFAAFQALPKVVFVPNTPVTVINNSAGATSYFWDYGSQTPTPSTSTETDGTIDVNGNKIPYSYAIEGQYTITLIASNDHGNGIVCTDTATTVILAKQGGISKLPNAFTPSLDGPTGGHSASGSNYDVFLPSIKGVEEYNLQIYDRWGNMLFESNSVEIGWDGYKDGKLLPAGVYVYKITLRLSDGQRTTQVGDVTMIR